MRYFPLFYDTKGRRVGLVGSSIGGDAIESKLRLFAKTQAELVLYVPRPDKSLERFVARKGIALHRRLPDGDELTRFDILILDRAHRHLAAKIKSLESTKAKPLIAVIDGAEDSDFITGALVDRDPVTIAIGTEGTAPVLARRLKHAIEPCLPRTLGALATRAAALRARLRDDLPDPKLRRRFWEKFFDLSKFRLSSEPSELFSRPLADASVPMASLVDADIVAYEPEYEGLLEATRREARFIEIDKSAGAHDTITHQLDKLATPGQRVFSIRRDARTGDPVITHHRQSPNHALHPDCQ